MYLEEEEGEGSSRFYNNFVSKRLFFVRTRLFVVCACYRPIPLTTTPISNNYFLHQLDRTAEEMFSGLGALASGKLRSEKGEKTKPA